MEVAEAMEKEDEDGEEREEGENDQGREEFLSGRYCASLQASSLEESGAMARGQNTSWMSCVGSDRGPGGAQLPPLCPFGEQLHSSLQPRPTSTGGPALLRAA